ncbi:MAG: cation diffusion facilitator family transporter [Alistipes sp.]
MTHSHAHLPASVNLTQALMIGIALNVSYAAVECGIGIYYHSMGLISDAGHNLSDVVSLILALLALYLVKRPANNTHTYGYKKSTILISLLNAVILLVAVGVIITESINKFIHPVAVEGSAIAWTAGVGVIINALTAWLFLREKNRDLNVKGVYLHMVADALVSVGVVISGVVIAFTQWTIIDPIIGLLVAGVIVITTWELLMDSLRLSLDGVPEGVEMDQVRQAITAVDGIRDLHHLHVWALSTTENALTAHIIVTDLGQLTAVREAVRQRLDHLGISHVTLEVETAHTDSCDQCE